MKNGHHAAKSLYHYSLIIKVSHTTPSWYSLNVVKHSGPSYQDYGPLKVPFILSSSESSSMTVGEAVVGGVMTTSSSSENTLSCG